MKTTALIIVIAALAIPLTVFGQSLHARCDLYLNEGTWGSYFEDLSPYDHDGFSKKTPTFTEDYAGSSNEAMVFDDIETDDYDCVAVYDASGDLELTAYRDMTFNLWFMCEDIELQDHQGQHRVLLSNRVYAHNQQSALKQGLMIATGYFPEQNSMTGVVAQLFKFGEEKRVAKVHWNSVDLEDSTWYQVHVAVDRDDSIRIWIRKYNANWQPGNIHEDISDWEDDDLSTGNEWCINYDFRRGAQGIRDLQGAICDLKIFYGAYEPSQIEEPLTVFKPVISNPSDYKLNPATPNPFNSKTILTYELPNTGMVKLVVYDLYGREVGLLVDRIVSSGIHNDIFDASDLSSGVYFAHFQAGGCVKTQKLLLVK